MRSRQRGSASVELVLLTPVMVLLAWWAADVGRRVDAAATVRLAAYSAARAASMVRTSAMTDTAQRTVLTVLADRNGFCDSPRVAVRVTSTAVTVDVVCHVDGRPVAVQSTEVIDRFRSDR